MRPLSKILSEARETLAAAVLRPRRSIVMEVVVMQREREIVVCCGVSEAEQERWLCGARGEQVECVYGVRVDHLESEHPPKGMWCCCQGTASGPKSRSRHKLW